MEDKNKVHRFLKKSEIIKIIDLMKNIDSDDIKARFYLLTLGYKSIDIQNFTIDEAKDIIKDNNLPEYMISTFRNSLNDRLRRIEENNLQNDLEYLFVNAEDKHIHDCVALRDWRRFLKSNDIKEINMHVYRQSIKYLQVCQEYKKQKEKEYDLEV